MSVRKNEGFAFFDVDETIVNEKTMFTILSELGEHFEDFDDKALLKKIRELRDLGVPRETVNQSFYRGLKSLPMDEVAGVANRYITERIHKHGQVPFFIDRTVNLLKACRANKLEPVFVSGSAVDFIRPIAEFLRVEHILATELAVDSKGRYTGLLSSRCMIGQGKADAVSEFLTLTGFPPNNCIGVGDHVSDAAFISLLGRGVVISGQLDAEALARKNGWDVLFPAEAA